MGTSLNKTSSLYLKNNSGQTVTKGDVVVLDKTIASAFTLTGSAAYSLTQIGVVLDQTNVAAGTSCLVAIEGYVPVINLVTGANIGDSFYLSAVSKKAQSHSAQISGDFGYTLSAGTTPDAIILGSVKGGSGYAILQDQRPQNTSGGTFTSGAWQTRPLNTIVVDTINITLSSNQFTLPPGTYKLRASTAVYQTDRNQLRLQNITDGTTTILGMSFFSAAAVNSEALTVLSAKFTITSSKIFELQHQAQTTSTPRGFGVEANFTTEVYATVEIERE